MMLKFQKMHGLGNDFVIIDGRYDALKHIAFDGSVAARLADRRYGIGCDQLIMLRPSARAQAHMLIYNADGSQVGACGNATRCVAWLLGEQDGRSDVAIETNAGLLQCELHTDHQVSVNMGKPACGWDAIPMANACDTLHVTHGIENIAPAVATNVGNPHLTLFVDNALDSYYLEHIGARLERDAMFPERANISLAQIVDGSIRLRTWERGAGITQACGTAACAAAVAARRRGYSSTPTMEVVLPGGELTITWHGDAANTDADIIMRGSAEYVFSGQIDMNMFTQTAAAL